MKNVKKMLKRIYNKLLENKNITTSSTVFKKLNYNDNKTSLSIYFNDFAFIDIYKSVDCIAISKNKILYVNKNADEVDKQVVKMLFKSFFDIQEVEEEEFKKIENAVYIEIESEDKISEENTVIEAEFEIKIE